MTILFGALLIVAALWALRHLSKQYTLSDGESRMVEEAEALGATLFHRLRGTAQARGHDAAASGVVWEVFDAWVTGEGKHLVGITEFQRAAHETLLVFEEAEALALQHAPHLQGILLEHHQKVHALLARAQRGEGNLSVLLAECREERGRAATYVELLRAIAHKNASSAPPPGSGAPPPRGDAPPPRSDPPPRTDPPPRNEGRIPTHYEILEIPRTATQEEIRSAFKRLSMLYHPDKVHHLAPEFREMAGERFKKINEAHSVLSDPEQRRRYDATH